KPNTVNSKQLIPLLSFTILSFASSIHSQDRPSNVTNFRNPSEIKLRVNRVDYNRSGVNGDFGVEKFFPIGWSKDGKFAYYVEPIDEACGCYFGKLVIVDLKTDAVLWQFDYSSEETDESRTKKPKSLRALWNVNRKLFSSKLTENNIEPQSLMRVLPFPITDE